MSGFNHPVISAAFKLHTGALCAIAFSFLLLSCEPETRHARSTDHIRMMDEKLISYNRQAVQSESNEIEDYIVRHRWKMLKTSTGLRYNIYKAGNGKKIIKGAEVRLRYKLFLMNGGELYNSETDGIRIIYPGASEGETGLQEALLLMRQGDCAKLIVPSHLAFGLLGDLKRIPASATLVYDIESLDPAP
ncbi:MAG: FKBP-type peptidyl-prolyl cis-trans isomerase [Bacteroidales bacterium]